MREPKLLLLRFFLQIAVAVLRLWRVLKNRNLILALKVQIFFIVPLIAVHLVLTLSERTCDGPLILLLLDGITQGLYLAQIKARHGHSPRL